MAVPDEAALDTRLTHLRHTDATRFLEELFKTFYAPLGAIVYRVVPDRAAVDDLLQNVFLRVWQGRESLPVIASHRAYLTRMALNAALSYHKRDQRQVAWDKAAPVVAATDSDALVQLYAVETGAAVTAALAHLPPQCRIIFELSRYEELSYQQIAEALELAPKTVENQMGKALRILRRELAGVLRHLYYLLLLAGAARSASGLPAPLPAPLPGAAAGAAYFGAGVGVAGPWVV